MEPGNATESDIIQRATHLEFDHDTKFFRGVDPRLPEVPHPSPGSKCDDLVDESDPQRLGGVTNVLPLPVHKIYSNSYPIL